MIENNNAFAEFLTQVPVFKKFNNRDRNDLAQLATWKKYDKGELVAHVGDEWPYVMVIAEGEIRGMKISPEGRLLNTLKIQKGEGFWNPSIFDGLPLLGSIEVWEPSEIYLWHKDLIIPFLKENPDAIWQINLELVKHLRNKSELIENFAFSTISRRLARLLLDQFEGVTETSITRNMSLEEIGTIIGTTPIMICKHISRFAEKGLITVSRSEFILSNKVALKEIANEV